MIVKKEDSTRKNTETCLKIEEKQKMRGQASRIFLNLVIVDHQTDEKTEQYLADFPLGEKKTVLSWLMEPCRRRAISNMDSLSIDRKFMLDGYNDLFKRVVLI